MNISVDSAVGGGGDPITIMRLKGELDARSYLEVIERVRQLHDEGTRRLLLDLSDLTFLSSAGLVALHSAVMIMRGQRPPDVEEGWNVFHAMSNEVESGEGQDAALRILRPQERVARALEMSGFSRIIPNYSDEQEAISSFGG